MDETAFADWSYPGRGLIRGEALARFVRDKTNRRDIEQMRIPLGIAATDLDSGEGILFRSGDTGTAVRASSAVPAVFQPVKIGTREYVDGGLSAPIPVHHARQMGAEFVIAVDISAHPEGNATGDAARMLLQTFAIMGKSLKNYELKDADVVLQPALAGVSGADFTTRRQSIKAGRDVTLAHLGELRERLAARGRRRRRALARGAVARAKKRPGRIRAFLAAPLARRMLSSARRSGSALGLRGANGRRRHRLEVRVGDFGGLLGGLLHALERVVRGGDSRLDQRDGVLGAGRRVLDGRVDDRHELGLRVGGRRFGDAGHFGAGRGGDFVDVAAVGGGLLGGRLEQARLAGPAALARP